MSISLITGGAGFVATNTADRLLSTGTRVRILDDLSRAGVEQNLKWLEQRHGNLLEVEIADVRDRASVRTAVRGADEIFHFAAQVAVTTSLEEPMHDATVNILGTLNLLEEARTASRPPSLVFTSTNKVYGALPGVEVQEFEGRWEPEAGGQRATGISERQPLQFCTPYGCSKGAADQYVRDWAASYGVPTVVMRMSCIYGRHQFGTEDQGWVAHFLIRALQGAPITIFGDGKQVRDILYVEDLVDALIAAQTLAPELAGTAFNIGGGPDNSVSLLQVIDLIAELIGERPRIQRCPWRQGDQRYYVTDHGRFSAAAGWRPQTDPRQGISLLHSWLQEMTAETSVAA